MSIEALETLRSNLKKARDNCEGRYPYAELNKLYGDVDRAYWKVVNTTLRENWYSAKDKVARVNEINKILTGHLKRLQDIEDALALLNEAVKAVLSVIPVK